MSNHTNTHSGIFAIAVNLTLASLISGIIIAGVYFITFPFAEKQKVLAKNQSLQELVSNADQFVPIPVKTDWFRVEKSGKTIAYIVPAEGKGYGGLIKILLAVDVDLKIIDYRILIHNETPGLGDVAATPKFSTQFKGKKSENMEVVKRHEDGKIDAISGATITSKAVTHAIKEGLVLLEEYLKNQKGK